MSLGTGQARFWAKKKAKTSQGRLSPRPRRPLSSYARRRFRMASTSASASQLRRARPTKLSGVTLVSTPAKSGRRGLPAARRACQRSRKACVPASTVRAARGVCTGRAAAGEYRKNKAPLHVPPHAGVSPHRAPSSCPRQRRASAGDPQPGRSHARRAPRRRHAQARNNADWCKRPGVAKTKRMP
jgi:hypothetical protein